MLITGLDVEDGESADTIVALFKHLIATLGKADFSNKMADDIVWILLMEVGVHISQWFITRVKPGNDIYIVHTCSFSIPQLDTLRVTQYVNPHSYMYKYRCQSIG